MRVLNEIWLSPHAQIGVCGMEINAVYVPHSYFHSMPVAAAATCQDFSFAHLFSRSRYPMSCPCTLSTLGDPVSLGIVTRRCRDLYTVFPLHNWHCSIIERAVATSIEILSIYPLGSASSPCFNPLRNLQ